MAARAENIHDSEKWRSVYSFSEESAYAYKRTIYEPAFSKIVYMLLAVFP